MNLDTGMTRERPGYLHSDATGPAQRIEPLDKKMTQLLRDNSARTVTPTVDGRWLVFVNAGGNAGVIDAVMRHLSYRLPAGWEIGLVEPKRSGGQDILEVIER